MNKSKIILVSFMIASLAIFLLLAILVATNNTILIDKFCFDIFTANRLSFFNWFFVIITFLGETKIIILLCLILLILPNRNKLGVPLIITVICSTLINLLIKLIFQRARPIGYFLADAPLGFAMPTSYSFASGHAQTATVFYFVLTYLLIKNYINKDWLKLLLWGLTISICVLLPVSRVYLGVHFFSDIIAGLMLAVFIISAFVYADSFINFKRFLHKNKPN